MDSSVPCLVEHTISPASVSEKGNMFIVSISNGKFIKVSESVKLIIEEVDGTKSYDEIAATLNNKYGADINSMSIRELIVSVLAPQGLVKGINIDHDPSSNSRLWIHFRLFDGKIFEKLALKLTFLFNWRFALIVLGLTVFSAFYFIGDFSFFLGRKPSANSTVVTLLIYLFSLVLHEIGHVVACYRFGVKPRGMGIGIYLFMPVFFTDMSEVWVLNREQRVVTGLGGFYFQLILMSLLFPIVFLNNPLCNVNNYKVLLQLTLLAIFLNLNPLMKMDGYWVLSDLMGTVNIHKRSMYIIVNFFRKIFHSKKYSTEKDYELTPAAKKIFIIWSFGYIFIAVAVISIAVVKLSAVFKPGVHKSFGSIALLFIFAVMQAFVPTIKNKVNKYKRRFFPKKNANLS
jgi:putative peptide zinc metalloprotease protein